METSEILKTPISVNGKNEVKQKSEALNKFKECLKMKIDIKKEKEQKDSHLPYARITWQKWTIDLLVLLTVIGGEVAVSLNLVRESLAITDVVEGALFAISLTLAFSLMKIWTDTLEQDYYQNKNTKKRNIINWICLTLVVAFASTIGLARYASYVNEKAFDTVTEIEEDTEDNIRLLKKTGASSTEIQRIKSRSEESINSILKSRSVDSVEALALKSQDNLAIGATYLISSLVLALLSALFYSKVSRGYAVLAPRRAIEMGYKRIKKNLEAFEKTQGKIYSIITLLELLDKLQKQRVDVLSKRTEAICSNQFDIGVKLRESNAMNFEIQDLLQRIMNQK